MSALLDVNVLIALAWPNHVHHRAAREWFLALPGDWATTPMTEAGFVRVSSHRGAIATASTPETAVGVLKQLTLHPRHRFLADDVAFVTGSLLDPADLTSHKDVTDAHLLALASRHRSRLVTFDARIARLAGAHASALEVLAS
jgi:uncharacterized protein